MEVERCLGGPVFEAMEDPSAAGLGFLSGGVMHRLRIQGYFAIAVQ